MGTDRLGRLQDHTGKHREGDWDGLRRELSQKGYLLIRGLHSREEVLAARKVVLEHVAASGPGKLVGPTESGDVSLDMGCLAVIEASNQASQFKHLQETYGSCDLEAESVEGSGWFTEDPTEISSRFNCDWKTESFSAGDVLIFTSRTIHMSTKNMSELLRVSCVTRWQLADQPVDPRYVGESFPWLGKAPKHGLWAEEEQSEKLTMDDMKTR